MLSTFYPLHIGLEPESSEVIQKTNVSFLPRKLCPLRHFPEHYTLWQAHVIHRRHKLRKRDPPFTMQYCGDDIPLRLREDVKRKNRVVGALMLSHAMQEQEVTFES